MAPGLLRMPTELQHMITNLTGRKDILALRLVCRDLSRAVDEPFLEAFYSKRRHLITPYSVEYLVEISKNARLRRRLKEVEFVIAELSSWFDHYYSVILLSSKGFTEEQIQASKEMSLAKTALRNRWNVERKLLRSKRSMNLMATALRNLNAANIVPVIALGSNPTYPRTACGTQQLATKLATYPAIQSKRLEDIFEQSLEYDSKGNASVHLNMILTVVANSKFPLGELDVQCNTPVHLAECCLRCSQHDGSKASFENLTALTLSLKAWHEASHEDQDDDDACQR